MKRKVGYTWRLREIMAQHQIFTATELVPLLHERGIARRRSPGEPRAPRCPWPTADRGGYLCVFEPPESSSSFTHSP
ncbi:hypothetical protein ACWGI0_23715 [Streptomyces sp. NPDC054802]